MSKKTTNSFKHNKLIIVFSLFVPLLICLVILELIIGKYFPQKTYSRVFQENNNCFKQSPFTVFELKPNCLMKFQNYDTGELFTTKTNSLGLRGNDFTVNKNRDEKRILIEGDSFILGFGVKDNEVISYDLEQLLKNDKSNTFQNTKVINAGYAGGFGPDGYYLYLKSKGIKLKPDLVVFSVFVYNDFSDLYNDNWFGAGIFGEPKMITSKTVTVDDKGYLVSKSTPFIYRIPILRESNLAILTDSTIKTVLEKITRVVNRIRFKLFPADTPSSMVSDNNLLGPYITRCIFWDTCHRQALHLYSDLLSVIKASKSLTNQFVVLLIPADFQIYKEAIKNYKDTGLSLESADFPDPNPQKRLKEIFAQEKIPYIDLLPVFRKTEEQAYFAKDGHWNALGHKIAAQELTKWIENNYR